MARGERSLPPTQLSREMPEEAHDRLRGSSGMMAAAAYAHIPDSVDETSALLFDHVGVIVPDLAAGRDFLAAALDIRHWTPVIDDAGLRVSVQFGSSARDGLVYELVAPFGEESPIANALRSGKHVLNHLAYRTGNLQHAGERLRAQGCYPAGAAQRALAYGGQKVQFFVSPLRFIIELIEKPDHQHAFEEWQRNQEARR